MTKNLITLALSTLFLAACGGGGGGVETNFTITRNWDGTTYSCPTQSAYDQCKADVCTQCTCTVGCEVGAAKVKLKVSMTPSTLKVNQQGDLTLQLSNSASVKQTIKFSLATPSGGVGYTTNFGNAPFSAGCNTLDQSLGGKAVGFRVVVPASNTANPCVLTLRKSFTEPANPVVFSLEGLDRVELDGSLPLVTVTP